MRYDQKNLLNVISNRLELLCKADNKLLLDHLFYWD